MEKIMMDQHMFESMNELDFQLKISHLQKDALEKERDVQAIEDRLEKLSKHSVRSEDDVLHLVQQVRESLKLAEQVLLDMKDTFKQLNLWGVYSIFSNLSYSLFMAVGILAEACHQGVDCNIISYAKSHSTKKNLHSTICQNDMTPEQSNKNITSLQSQPTETNFARLYTDMQMDMEIDRMYNQALLERDAVKRITPSGITTKLEQMGTELDGMIEKSELILEEAYLRNCHENKDRSGVRYHESHYINNVFQGELIGILRSQISQSMKKMLGKLYHQFLENEKKEMLEKLEREKPLLIQCEQQTQLEGLVRVKAAYRDKRIHDKSSRDFADLKKQSDRMTEQYIRATRQNEIDSIKIGGLEKTIEELRHKYARLMKQSRDSEISTGGRRDSRRDSKRLQEIVVGENRNISIMGLEYRESQKQDKEFRSSPKNSKSLKKSFKVNGRASGLGLKGINQKTAESQSSKESGKKGNMSIMKQDSIQLEFQQSDEEKTSKCSSLDITSKKLDGIVSKGYASKLAKTKFKAISRETPKQAINEGDGQISKIKSTGLRNNQKDSQQQTRKPEQKTNIIKSTKGNRPRMSRIETAALINNLRNNQQEQSLQVNGCTLLSQQQRQKAEAKANEDLVNRIDDSPDEQDQQDEDSYPSYQKYQQMKASQKWKQRGLKFKNKGPIRPHLKETSNLINQKADSPLQNQVDTIRQNENQDPSQAATSFNQLTSLKNTLTHIAPNKKGYSAARRHLTEGEEINSGPNWANIRFQQIKLSDRLSGTRNQFRSSEIRTDKPLQRMKKQFHKTFNCSVQRKQTNRMISFIPIQRVLDTSSKYELFAKEVSLLLEGATPEIIQKLKEYAPRACKVLLGKNTFMFQQMEGMASTMRI